MDACFRHSSVPFLQRLRQARELFPGDKLTFIYRHFTPVGIDAQEGGRSYSLCAASRQALAFNALCACEAGREGYMDVWEGRVGVASGEAHCLYTATKSTL